MSPNSHAKVSCKVQCMKFSVNIRGHKEEQLILDARSRSSKDSKRALLRILRPTEKCDTFSATCTSLNTGVYRCIQV